MLFFCLLQLVPQLQHQSIASDMHIFRDWISTKPDRSTEYVRRSNTLAACCLRVHLGLNPAIFNEGFAMFHFHFFWQLFIPVFGPWCLQRILKIIFNFLHATVLCFPVTRPVCAFELPAYTTYFTCVFSHFINV